MAMESHLIKQVHGVSNNDVAINILTFQLNFISEAFLMDLVILILKRYL